MTRLNVIDCVRLVLVAAIALLLGAGCDDGGGGDDVDQDGVVDTSMQPDTADPDTASPDPVCGDGTVEADEVCDGDALAGESCAGLGLGEGTLGCSADCTAFDTAGCAPAAVCGDDLVQGTELCDGIDLGDASCASLGFDAGVLLCNAFCDGYDTAECSGARACGDDVVNPGEVCDGTALDDQTCITLGFAAGTLSCTADCQGFDTSACLDACGNNLIDADETCDGTNLGGASCESLGYGGGTLSCTATCTLDETACLPDTCGNAVVDPGEDCDGVELDGASCESLGYDAGALACSACLFDLGACTSCGDGVIGGDEVCDGDDVQGVTCLDLDFDGGDLGCAADCLELDTTACTGGAPRTPEVGDLVITEIMKDPDAVADELGEYFEIYNPSASVSFELQGCTVAGTNDTGAAIMSSLVIAPGGYLTFASSSSGTSTPGFTADFVYDRNSLQLANGDDSVTLSCVGAMGPVLVDAVDYSESLGFADLRGASLNLDPGSYDAALNDDGANWCASTTALPMSTDLGTAGAANEMCP